jgi:hypothetical protein
VKGARTPDVDTLARAPREGHEDGNDGDGAEGFRVHLLPPGLEDDVGYIDGEGGYPAADPLPGPLVFALCSRDPDDLWGVAMTPAAARTLARNLLDSADLADAVTAAHRPMSAGGSA